MKAFRWFGLAPVRSVFPANARKRVAGAKASCYLILALAGCDGTALTPEDIAAPLNNKGSVSGLVITPSEASVEIGQTLQLTATDGSGSTVNARWSSSDPVVATISEKGLVTGFAKGSVTITARTSRQTATASITINIPLSGPSLPAACAGATYTRLVTVGTAAGLRDALSKVQPGDLIHLANGVYAGSFNATISGTAERPITLCGSRAAIIDAGSLTQPEAAVYLTANHWTMAGFTIRNTKRAILAERANYNTFRDLEIYNIGQEAVHLRIFSSYNTIERSTINNTGLTNAEWGEGIYIGSWNGHWCTFTNCEPDRSDYNQILDNVLGPNVAAEHIDLKEGTTGGVVRGNTFNGDGMVPSQPWIDSWVLVQGNGYTVSDNSGTTSLAHGFKTEVMLQGWANDNTFTNNTADVRAGGYGFRIMLSGSKGNVVSCANAVTNAGSGFANTSCK